MPTMALVWIGFMIVAPIVMVVFGLSRRKAALAQIDVEAERKRAEEHRKDLLKNGCAFLTQWMEGAPIDAYTSASIPMTMGDHAKNMAKDVAKSAAWAMVGVKARYQRVETASYVVMSNGDMHFFSTDVDGDLDQHVVFDADTLKAASLARDPKAKTTPHAITAAETFTFNQAGKHPLSVGNGEDSVTIAIHDRVLEPPSVMAFLGSKDFYMSMVKKRLAGDHFFAHLAEKHPNLRMQ